MPTSPTLPTDVEYRILARPLEIRQQPGDAEAILAGYAAVFNELSVDLGGWREIIMPGAFAAAIVDADVRSLWQHNSEFVLGRTTNNTLRLVEDEIGLRSEIDPPATTWAADALISMRRVMKDVRRECGMALTSLMRLVPRPKVTPYWHKASWDAGLMVIV